MRVSSRSSSSVSFILVLLGTGALLVLLIVLITGGFVIDAGPLHFSSRRWPTPLALAAVAWLAAVLVGGRRGAADAMAELSRQLDRQSAAVAGVIAMAAVGAGIGLGTYAASGADASGYVSQAQLLAAARVSSDEPLARLLPWTNVEWVFSPLGYRPGPAPGEIVPSYPPGLPLTMAAARAVGGEWAVFLVVPLLGGLAVFHTYLLGARLHSRCSSPFRQSSAPPWPPAPPPALRCSRARTCSLSPRRSHFSSTAGPTSSRSLTSGRTFARIRCGSFAAKRRRSVSSSRRWS